MSDGSASFMARPFFAAASTALDGGDLDFKKKSDLRRLGRDIYNFVVALIAVMEREGLGWGFVFVFLFLFLCFSFS